MEKPALGGIHHVTAIAGDARSNVEFYVGLLGLRLVKRTVNFDDPGTYHLYYGDEVGNPGSILTFFPWAHAVRGGRGVGETIATAFSVPEGALGFWRDRLAGRGVASGGGRSRFAVGPGGAGAEIDLIEDPAGDRGRSGRGTVHHVAFRVEDAAAQEAWLADLAAHGLHVTPIQDRQYFHSIYYREPGGVLFELATDPPGFTFDEPVATLGTELMLPPWLEAARPRIVASLPRLQVPSAESTPQKVRRERSH